MKKRLSIVDIANALQISKTTVSFILGGKSKEKRISSELEARVVKFVEEVGYKPNSLAKSLRTGKSKTIGFIVEDISNPFFSNIARRIEDVAYENGYKIFYSSTDNDLQKTKDLISVMRDRHVDGYIITPPLGCEAEISELINDNFPVVLFDRYLSNVKTDYVIVNNTDSAYKATIHLLEQGYKNIAFSTYFSLQMQMQDRLQGYKKAMKEYDLKPIVLKIQYNHDEEVIRESLADQLSKQTDIDAIFFGTNRIGICGLQVLNNLGKRVPGDVALISFDDHVAYELYSPSITAIAQPIEEIANSVIAILLDKLNKPVRNREFQSVILDTTLKKRNSIATKDILV